MEIKDRLRMIMDSHKLNAGSFADRIGVQRSNVSHVLSGRNKPGFDFMEKLLLAFPRVSAEWLFTGRQTLVKKTDLMKESEEISDALELQTQRKSARYGTGKKIVKTLIFYEDFTFDVFLPNEK
ncbi:helix-turn-helix transcriptional regulator [Fluviicola sp.]|jgi:transcriptional regulator with XRE-family HTH domain|uniref:helix-turn-helix domain-containing protein n=1 Tax=Fluviicola sp. TaxID=1917219 RepID=UPI002835ECC2|nr:helix-turn-helix transcriptional regulator [Fluviicola sp.]MDR0802578.1 helix-turn-helix domain-containing protein [Fluviicola sp.]